MRQIEVIQDYRWLLMEAMSIKHQADAVAIIGRPAGVGGQALSMAPGATNDRTAAAIQAFDGYMQQLEQRREELMQICAQFEKIVESIQDPRDRCIIRLYYGAGKTEEQVAEVMHMDQSTVNRYRARILSYFA